MGAEIKIDSLEQMCDNAIPGEQGTETWRGMHGLEITVPKGTFERIWNDAEEDDDDI